MIGLERLRELADDMSVQSLWGVIRDGKEERWNTRYGDGTTVNGMLREIADQIEAEQEERITRRVEDREAAEWVREQGGLGAVQTRVDTLRDTLDWLRERAGVGKDENIYYDDLLDAFDCRLMPSGTEWPKVDGEPVVIGEHMKSCGIEDCKVVGIDPVNSRLIFASDEIEEGKATYFPSLAKYCHRPAPKVLDAGGVEIRAGETLYHVGNYDSVTVRKLMPPDKFEDTEFVRHFVSEYTHRAPVLAADGKPLRNGETVYLIDSLNAFVVDDVMTKEDGTTVVHLKDGAWNYPKDITHERLDSWERLEKDIDDGPCVYFGRKSCVDCPGNGAKARDLVRRARALAERGNDEDR